MGCLLNLAVTQVVSSLVIFVEADGLRIGNVLGVVDAVSPAHGLHVGLCDRPPHHRVVPLREGILVVERVCIGIVYIILHSKE